MDTCSVSFLFAVASGYCPIRRLVGQLACYLRRCGPNCVITSYCMLNLFLIEEKDLL